MAANPSEVGSDPGMRIAPCSLTSVVAGAAGWRGENHRRHLSGCCRAPEVEDPEGECMGPKREGQSRGRRAIRRAKPRRWVKTATTVSTKAPPRLFTRDAATIARTLALPRVSPKGPVSGLRTLSFFINRAGRGLSRSRRAELEKAKRLMRMAISVARARH